MIPGYDRDLHTLAFEHCGSFQTQPFRIAGVPARERAAGIPDTRESIGEGFLEDRAGRKLGDGAGVLGTMFFNRRGGRP